ncbi:MAG: hypothetical protein HYZ28_23785 [Myxococcales bacterium]|nr:hypothetical protein [Myxococcales bacterium]
MSDLTCKAAALAMLLAGCAGPDLVVEVTREEGVENVDVFGLANPCQAGSVFGANDRERTRTVGVYRKQHEAGTIVLEFSSLLADGKRRRDRIHVDFQGSPLRFRLTLPADRCQAVKVEPLATATCRCDESPPAGCQDYQACSKCGECSG